MPTPQVTTSHIPTSTPDKTPLLVNIDRACKILSISRSSIYQLIWNDQLIPIRIGRSVRFTINQLEQFIADRVADSQE